MLAPLCVYVCPAACARVYCVRCGIVRHCGQRCLSLLISSIRSASRVLALQHDSLTPIFGAAVPIIRTFIPSTRTLIPSIRTLIPIIRALISIIRTLIRLSVPLFRLSVPFFGRSLPYPADPPTDTEERAEVAMGCVVWRARELRLELRQLRILRRHRLHDPRVCVGYWLRCARARVRLYVSACACACVRACMRVCVFVFVSAPAGLCVCVREGMRSRARELLPSHARF